MARRATPLGTLSFAPLDFFRLTIGVPWVPFDTPKRVSTVDVGMIPADFALFRQGSEIRPNDIPIPIAKGEHWTELHGCFHRLVLF